MIIAKGNYHPAFAIAIIHVTKGDKEVLAASYADSKTKAQPKQAAATQA